MPYHKHPRRNPHGSKQFEALCADVKVNGVKVRIFVRKTKGEKNEDGNELYEILSGHCRWEASKVAGFSTIPATILTSISDDEADEWVTSSNFGCNDFLPSEIGKFCKLWMEAKNKQGKRNSSADEVSNRKILVGMYGLSSMTDVHRHIRFAYLIPDFQDAVDYKKRWLGIGENVSYLEEAEQKILFQLLSEGNVELTLKQSKELKEAKNHIKENGNDGTLTKEQIKSILSSNNANPISEKKKSRKNYIVPRISIEQLVSRHFVNQEPSDEDVYALILKALEAYSPEN